VISARKLTVVYKRSGVVALRGVDLTIPSNTVTCILGPNASGKTTLLKAIAQVVDYTGVVEISGRDAKSMLRELRRILSYASVLEERELLGVTVLDVLVYSRYPVSKGFFTSREDVEKAREVAVKLGIEGLLGRRLGELSAGELQRVVLAAALAREPKVLLLDEPDSHLDVHAKTWLSEFLREISSSASSVTVVLSTHDPLFASATCEYFVVLSRGGVVFAGSKSELLENAHILEEVYGVPFTSVSLGDYRVLIPLSSQTRRVELASRGEPSRRETSCSSSSTRGDH
jgi:iron complex transport system ATP-binding protein